MQRLRVNVRDTGAKGDLTTDDTAAIQRALDGGQRTVIIPTGRYKISAALQVDSETRIQAAPDAIIQLANGAGNGPNVFLLKNRDAAGGSHDIIVEAASGTATTAPIPGKGPCYTGWP